ncbi:MAG: hypothetical protein ABI408_13080 [Gemmatimonadaceae bacterium]
MRTTPFILATLVVFAVFDCCATAGGQVTKSIHADSVIAESDQRPPEFATGVTAGAMDFIGGRSEQAFSVLIQYQPTPWLSLSAAPGYGRTTLLRSSSNGPTDIPVTAAAQYARDRAAGSPIVVGFLSTLLSTGQSGSALSIGRSSVLLGGAVRVTPMDRLYVSASGSQPVTAASGNGSVQMGVARSFGRATPSIGFGTEIGTPDSAATLARSIAGGVAIALAGPLTLALDGNRGLTSGAPRWTFSVGVGTAFAGLSPMNGSFGRLRNVFGSRASSTSGYSKSTTCKRLGTC